MSRAISVTLHYDLSLAAARRATQDPEAARVLKDTVAQLFLAELDAALAANDDVPDPDQH